MHIYAYLRQTYIYIDIHLHYTHILPMLYKYMLYKYMPYKYMIYKHVL